MTLKKSVNKLKLPEVPARLGVGAGAEAEARTGDGKNSASSKNLGSGSHEKVLICFVHCTYLLHITIHIPVQLVSQLFPAQSSISPRNKIKNASIW